MNSLYNNPIQITIKAPPIRVEIDANANKFIRFAAVRTAMSPLPPILQQHIPAVTPASNGHRPKNLANNIAPINAPNTPKMIIINAPILKNSVKSVNFNDLIPIPAISIGRSAFKAKFIEYIVLSTILSGKTP